MPRSREDTPKAHRLCDSPCGRGAPLRRPQVAPLRAAADAAPIAAGTPPRRVTCRCRTAPKITPSRSSAENSPVIAASACCASRSSSAKSSIGGGAAATWPPPRARCAAASRSAATCRSRARYASSVALVGADDREDLALERASTPSPVFADSHTCGAAAPSSVRASACGAIAARSALLCTTTRGSAAGRRARIARSAAGSACAAARASTISTTRSARSTAAHVRSMPMRSTASSVSRRPAVSTTVSGMPAISITRSTGSRVVPGIGVTIAASSRASALSRLDLPTFGSPDQHDRQALAQQRAGARAREHLRELRAQVARACARRRPRAGTRRPPRESRASPPCTSAVR